MDLDNARTMQLLAFDFGAGSGRAMLGSFDGNRLNLQEVHRFPNEPVQAAGSLHWDVLRLYHELKQGLAKGAKAAGTAPAALSVDTWGVDFGLLDKDGRLLGNPHHYRDKRTDGIMERAGTRLPLDELYRLSGIQLMRINTVFQLFAMAEAGSPQLAAAETLLFMPDLFHYFLTGVQSTEYTIASTSGLLQPGAPQWADAIVERLGLPGRLLKPVVMPGTALGALGSDVREELGLSGSMQVIAGAAHDTAAAVAAVPAAGSGFAYISCGTWSLMGIETDRPIVTEETRKLGYTNEGGVAGKTRFLKNIMGLWLLQECRRQWSREGQDYSYPELEALAANAAPLRSFVDPDDAVFLAPGDMPARIRGYCRRTGQPVPESAGEIVRCILESLALKYKRTLDELERLSGRMLPHLHLVGGGCRNKLLCRFAADASGRPVTAGPVEATAAGNLLVQAMALGAVGSLHELREVVRASFPAEIYEPAASQLWPEANERFERMLTDAGR